jgi:hypothetical protein
MTIISFDEMRRRLVDGLECSAPGRNRIWSIGTVQRRKFITITSLYSSGFRVLRIVCEKIYHIRMKEQMYKVLLELMPVNVQDEFFFHDQ